jgi:hypothetical protein
VSRSLFSPSNKRVHPLRGIISWTHRGGSSHARRIRGRVLCLHPETRSLQPTSKPAPGLGSEPMETARSRPALVVLDSTLLWAFMRLAARGGHTFVTLEVGEDNDSRVAYTIDIWACKSNTEYSWH